MYEKGFGFSPAYGVSNAPLLFIGEALGFNEALAGEPFVGAAGGMLERLFKRSSINREQVRIANCVSCFPGDTLIQAPDLRRGFRRRYRGQMVTATTDQGVLTGTPNHPVLTATGWKGLGELREGDYLIRPRISERVDTIPPYPDVQHPPAPIAKIFQSLADRWGRTRVVGADVDFHGDGANNEIEVVPVYGKLLQGIAIPVLEQLLRDILELPDYAAGDLSLLGTGFSATLNLLSRRAASPSGSVGRSREPQTPFSPFPVHPEPVGVGLRPARNMQDRQRLPHPSMSEMETALDLFRTLATQVELCEVTGVSLSQFDGHVYNLETGSHKYIANGFIVHNCQPPGDWLDGAPWEYAALNACQQYLNPILAEDHRVIVTLGAIPLRQVLNLWGVEGVRVQDFHGTVHQRPDGRWVVPTYHPSFLQRGAINLLDVVRSDLAVASKIVREGGWAPRPVSLLLDPSPTGFALWGSGYLREVARDPGGCWLAVDIETKDKEGGRDEGELSGEDLATEITRVNFSYQPDEGITVPYEGPYRELIDKILAAAGIILMWNKGYDEPRLRAHHPVVGREIWDLMWAAHHLQSDLPLGLGFWAPFYSDYGAWKHLGKQRGQEAKYAGIDGFQTLRIGRGVVKDLVDAGMWPAFYRHTHLREQYVLRPAHEIGLLVDVPRLDAFHDKLQGHAASKLARIGEQQIAGNLYPKQGYKEKPAEGKKIPQAVLGKHLEKGDHAKAEYIAEGIRIVQKEIPISVRVCGSCGKDSKIGPKHNCLRRGKSKGRTGSDVPTDTLADPEVLPVIVTTTRQELRWFYQLPFNPDASQQILKFITDSGETPGKAKKTKKATANKETLRKLAKKTGLPVYQDILDYKAIKKVDSTYAVGAKKRIWESDGRLHATITFRPSTHRDSSVNPNIQNVIADKGGKDNLAAGFRECIVASPGCRLLEVDYSGIEGVETGWLAGDPDYIRLAYLGVHAYLASHLIERPADLRWSDGDLAGYFAEIKKKFPVEYDRAKRCVHGNNYGLTIHGMVENFPESFPDLKEAKRVQELYFLLAPKLQAFHDRCRDNAYKFGRLGGPPSDDYYELTQSGQHHPYAYRHWFWGVQSYRPVNEAEYRKAQVIGRAKGTLRANGLPSGYVSLNHRPFKVQLGEDSKRVIAFYPQSIAAGRLKEAEIELFHPDSPDYLGDMYYGRTPFRHPIHDSLFLEVPDQVWDYVVETVVAVMRRPELRQPVPAEWGIGNHLRIGVAAKAGRDWMHMEEINLPEMVAETAKETMFFPVDEADLDMVQDLQTEMRG